MTQPVTQPIDRAVDRTVVPDEGTATQVYRIVIRATPQQIWDAITLPEFTRRYFHGAAITITPDHYVSYGPDGDVWGDADVLEWDPPRRLVHGWRSLYNADAEAEPVSRVTWEIEPADDAPACSPRSTTGSRTRRSPAPTWPGPAGWVSCRR